MRKSEHEISHRLLGCLICMMAFGVSLPLECFGQVAMHQSGSIQRLVKDPFGAAVPNASVVISSRQGPTKQVITNSSGVYESLGLAAGS